MTMSCIELTKPNQHRSLPTTEIWRSYCACTAIPEDTANTAQCFAIKLHCICLFSWRIYLLSIPLIELVPCYSLWKQLTSWGRNLPRLWIFVLKLPSNLWSSCFSLLSIAMCQHQHAHSVFESIYSVISTHRLLRTWQVHLLVEELMLIQISTVYTLRVCSQVEKAMQRIEAAWGRLLRGNSCYTVTKKIRRTTK